MINELAVRVRQRRFVSIAANRNAYQESYSGKERPARKADNLTATCRPTI
jgi:hypothetical protein